VRLVVTLTKAGGTLRYVVVSFCCVLQENRLRVKRMATAGYNDVLILNQDLLSEGKSQYEIIAFEIHDTKVHGHVTYLDSAEGVLMSSSSIATVASSTSVHLIA